MHISIPHHAKRCDELTILYVDDEIDTAQLMAMFIERRGHRMLYAATLAEGRALLASADVLVADVELPDGLGFELLDHGRPTRLERAVIVSGHSNVTAAALRAAFDATFDKPIDADELLRDLELPRRHACNETVMHFGLRPSAQ